MERKNTQSNNNPSTQSKVFKMCIAKCAKKDHINFAGEAIHHTVYQCMENCGYKWESLQASYEIL